MNRTIKNVTIIVSLFTACLFINVNAEAAEKTIGSFCYTYEELTQDRIWITKIDILSKRISIRSGCRPK